MARSAAGTLEARLVGVSRSWSICAAQLVLAVEPGAGHAGLLGDASEGDRAALLGELAQRVLGSSQGRVVAGLGGLAQSLHAVSHPRCLLRGVVPAGRR